MFYPICDKLNTNLPLDVPNLHKANMCSTIIQSLYLLNLTPAPKGKRTYQTDFNNFVSVQSSYKGINGP